MPRIPKLISKAKLARGFRCQKNLYLTINKPYLETPYTQETLQLFKETEEVTHLFQQQFKKGVYVKHEVWDFTGALVTTQQYIKNREPIIFEAAFTYQGLYARVDALLYDEASDRYKIYEVKSSTKIKPEQLEEIALSVWILAKSGLKILDVYLAHLNPDCSYPHLENLFVTHLITESMREYYPSMPQKLTTLLNSLTTHEIPNISIGSHCEKPTACGFMQHCFAERNIPEFSIFNLPNIYPIKWELYDKGIIHIDDARLNELSELQKNVIHAHLNNKMIINDKTLTAFFNQLTFPLYFLDFETIQSAIPRYEGQHPFKPVPFQFSVHSLKSFEDLLIHQEFLHTENTDPRLTLIPALIETLGSTGSIIAYFSQFEMERIMELASYSKTHEEALLALLPRFIDALPLIRENIYHPSMMGSFSLKKVVSALLDEQYHYQNLSIQNGAEAVLAYKELIDSKTRAERKAFLTTALLQYCAQDTLVLVELIKWLKQSLSH